MRFKRTWIVPAVLGGVVTLLVLSTRRPSPPRAATTPPQPPGTPQPTTPRHRPGSSETPRPADLPPEVVLEPGSILDVYRSLMGAMQADIRSVDPALLARLSQKLASFGHVEESQFAAKRAACAKDAREVPNDPDFFPLSCAAPGHVIFEAPPVITEATSALLTRYADAMSRNLYAKDSDIPDVPASTRASSFIRVADLETLMSELVAGGLTREAASLRARRDQLYQQKFDHSILRLQTARSTEEINREARVASELVAAGYVTLTDASGRSLYQAINDRKGELSSRNYACNVRTGCFVRSGSSDAAALVATLPEGAQVTVQRAEGAWSFASYDRVEGRPNQGWILTQALAPLVRA